MRNAKKINNRTLLIVMLLNFVALFLLFPAGCIHSSTKVEKTANYLSEVVEKHTTDGTYTALVVEPKADSEKTILDTVSEFQKLYAIFKEGFATYTGMANAEKSHTVTCDEIPEINFSILHIDRGFTVKKLKDSEGQTYYKQETYPLNLMYFSNRRDLPEKYGSDFDSFIYISKRRADYLLGDIEKDHTLEEYLSLRGTKINFSIDGKIHRYIIDNIYLETNYFCKAIDKVVGEFIFCGNDYNKYKVLNREAVFFLRNYTYQNKFFINYATNSYPESDFQYRFLTKNYKDGFTLDMDKVNLFPDSSSDGLSFTLGVFAFILLSSSIAIIDLKPFKYSLRNHVLVGLSLFALYFILWFVYSAVGNITLFSEYFTVRYLWFSFGYLILYLVLFLVKKGKELKGRKKDERTC